MPLPGRHLVAHLGCGGLGPEDRLSSTRRRDPPEELGLAQSAQAMCTSVPIGVYGHTAPAVGGGISTQPRL